MAGKDSGHCLEQGPVLETLMEVIVDYHLFGIVSDIASGAHLPVVVEAEIEPVVRIVSLLDTESDRRSPHYREDRGRAHIFAIWIIEFPVVEMEEEIQSVLKPGIIEFLKCKRRSHIAAVLSLENGGKQQECK